MSVVPGYHSVEEVAQAEGVHPETIKRRLRAGQLDGVKIDGRCWLIPENGQTAEVCPGCINNPVGVAPAGYDDDGNLWHMVCSASLLARYARLIVQRAHPRPEDEGEALQDESRPEKTSR